MEYHELQNPEAAIAYLQQCEWSAGPYLAKLIVSDMLTETMGENPRVFFLLEDDAVIAFATLTHQDAIRDETLFPWIGFVYTDPKHRGHRYSQRVIEHAISVARKDGYHRVYLETGEAGFYEKYGFRYLENRIDVWGEDSRIYYFPLEG